MEPTLSLDERFALLLSVGEECIDPKDLRDLLEKKPSIRCYDGFEPSGRMHIAQGLFKSVNVNKCTLCGCKFVFWVADWFAMMNDKLGGDIDAIRTVGKYFVEVWSAAGMDLKNVEFRWSSSEINGSAAEYWKRVLDIGRRNAIARIKKCCQIMGRLEGSLTAAQILYPLMQCSDIFHLKTDICQLGVDQRKVNMLAREYCVQIGKKLKPIVLSHHMLAGLKPGQAKMSKSDPDSAIFMEDSAEDVQRKIMNAYCPCIPLTAEQPPADDDAAPAQQKDKNPCLDYLHYIIFSAPNAKFSCANRVFTEYAAVEKEFLDGAITETNLKESLAEAINALLDPVRKHFSTNAAAKDLLERVFVLRSATAASPTKSSVLPPPPEKPHFVAWLSPRLKLPLDEALSIIETTKNFLDTNADASVTLLIDDWAAFARDELNEKDILPVVQYNVKLMQALGLDGRVKVVSQSEFIVANADAYWVTVITAGRKFTLNDIEASLGQPVQNAGCIISVLMRLSDAAMLGATTCAAVESELPKTSLIAKFLKARGGIIQTELGKVIPPLCQPGLHPGNADEVLAIDDTENDVRRKIKRAYAAPQELQTPIMTIASYIIAKTGGITACRSAENGGDKSFISPSALAEDYASGALHPGDLKPAVTSALCTLMQPVKAFLADSQNKKIVEAVRNAEKRAAKGAAAR